VRVAWVDSRTFEPPTAELWRRVGDQQQRRFAGLSGERARRFAAGRRLFTELIDDLTDGADAAAALSTRCEFCGQGHGRPRLVDDSARLSVSYAGPVVAVAVALSHDARAVGVDLERIAGAAVRMPELAPLFAPASPPDLPGWTLLEAALKADGRGIRVAVGDVRVGAEGTGAIAGSRAVAIPGQPGDVSVTTLRGPAGFVLSVALLEPAASVVSAAAGQESAGAR
jgi:4'-phosphopantetheinyl transferase